MSRIGIMQGRLIPPEGNRIQCFPREHWQEEFGRAAEARLDCIEWIFDLYGADVNPLLNEAGIETMRRLSEQHGVRILSVCADYFMDKPLVRATPQELEERLATLAKLTGCCRLLGITRIVLPFVDASRLETDAEIDSIAPTLSRTLAASEETGVEIHLETSLSPAMFADLLDRLPHPLLKVNYDSGNSASLGYHPREEFSAYGARIGSVHIKDRILGGGTVPLGTGNTDFDALFHELRRVGYSADFILQVARNTPGDEVSWASRNRAFVLDRLSS